MQSTVASPTSSPENPVDPAALKQLRRETKRLLDMSRGILQIAVGGACLACASLFAQPWLPMTSSLAVIGLPLMILLTAMVAQRLVSQARKRDGVPLVTLRARENQTPLVRSLMVLLLVAGVVAGLLDVIQSDSDPLRPGSVPFALFMLIVCLPLAIRGLRIGLWEDVLVAAGIPTAFALMMLSAGTGQLACLCLVLGCTQLIAGISLHARWKAWLGTLPPAAGTRDTAEAGGKGTAGANATTDTEGRA